MSERDSQLENMFERLEDLQSENRMLREQLERLRKSIPQRKEADRLPDWLKDPTLPSRYRELLATNMRLQTRAELYARLLRGLFKLGEKPADRKKGLRQFFKRFKPASLAPLGGKSFAQAIKAHARGGESEVDRLLEQVSDNGKLRADVYTAIARECQKDNPAQSERLAWRAWEANPRLYRLKWYAFRLYNSGRLLDSAALFELMGSGVPYAENEQKRVKRIQNEAANAIQSRLDEELDLENLAEEADASRLPEEIASRLGEINEKLEGIATARSRELALMLDCMDEQKENLRKSTEDMGQRALAGIREELAAISARDLAAAPDKNLMTLGRQLLLLRLREYADFGISPGLVATEDECGLEHLLLLLDLASSGKYQLIASFGVDAAIIQTARLVGAMNVENGSVRTNFIIFIKTEEELPGLEASLAGLTGISLVHAPLKKQADGKLFHDAGIIAKTLTSFPVDAQTSLLALLAASKNPDFSTAPAFAAILLPSLPAASDFVLAPGLAEKELLDNWRKTAKTLGLRETFRQFPGGAAILRTGSES